ncbi:THAP domain-containing protein 2-like [Rhopalosiphum padi]|uniref:THAP domain-containing protein 2-like n=1 Tax=Rhopalosiphum padi TaxID=40932 RepID=UPI00298E725C|nr:THAP domain-containing protein 2-like [Rhopalosiphum padi]
MVQKCCICKSQRSNENDITLHKFPKDTIICDKWVVNLNMNYTFTPTVHTRICSNHFDDNDFIKTDQLRRLKPDAIPTKMMGVRRSLFSVNVSTFVILEISRKKTWKPQEEENFFGAHISKC